MHTPDLMPILSAGSHRDPSKGACIMEMASFLAGEEWSDAPACTHPVLARMARAVNDRLPDSERGALLDLLPRLMDTSPSGTPEEQHRLSVGLAVWCAESATHLSGGAGPEAREAIRVTRAWLAGEATRGQCAAAAVAAYAAYADDATARAAAYAAGAVVAYAVSPAYAVVAHVATEDALVDLLTGLLDEHDRLTGRGEVPTLEDADVQALAALTN